MRWAGIAVAALFLSSASGQAADGTVIRYDGYAPDNFADIYRGDWKVGRVELHGELILPPGDGPFPVVVFQHGSGHKNNLESWYDYVTPELAARGIGSFIANSYDGRGIYGTAGDQRQLSKAARIVDALMALKAISQHPKVDARRVGVTGYSFGGVVAMETADRRTVEAVLGNSLKFAAHLPVYPGCGSHREKIDMTGAPMLFLVGADDDYTPARFCEAYIPKLRDAGVPAEIKVYPDAGHVFIKVLDRYLANAATFNECGISTITEEGYHALDDLTEKGKSWAEFVTMAFQICGDHGAQLYGTYKSRRTARDDTVAFFVKTLQP